MKIYYTDISENLSVSFDDYLDELSMERISKINSFRFYIDKYRSLISELLLKYSIDDFTKNDIKQEKLRFSFNEFGKPSLINYPEIKFNLSHSGKFVICAIGNTEVGTDIEEKKNIDFLNLINYFHPKEKEIIGRESSDMENIFFDIWTQKESYLKLIGTGITIPLNSFYIDPRYSMVIAENSIGYKNYYIQKINIDKGYACSICTKNKIFSTLINISAKKLLRYKLT